MYKTIFSIPKMDCPSEERILRMKLDDDLSIARLDFDIPKREMTVIHEGEAEAILEKLLPLNFGASLKSSFPTESTASGREDTARERKVLKLLFFINASMFLIEVIFGIFAESMGLISDSFDMFADASVYLISLYAVGRTTQAKKRSAKWNGLLQIVMGVGIVLETARRFIFGSDPEPLYMMGISLFALAANVYCLLLLSQHKEKGVHMKASYICSSTDVMANAGVILAGVLVLLTHSHLPDLIIGVVVALIVFKGALAILKLAE